MRPDPILDFIIDHALSEDSKKVDKASSILSYLNFEMKYNPKVVPLCFFAADVIATQTKEDRILEDLKYKFEDSIIELDIFKFDDALCKKVEDCEQWPGISKLCMPIILKHYDISLEEYQKLSFTEEVIQDILKHENEGFGYSFLDDINLNVKDRESLEEAKLILYCCEQVLSVTTSDDLCCRIGVSFLEDLLRLELPEIYNQVSEQVGKSENWKTALEVIWFKDNEDFRALSSAHPSLKLICKL